MIASPTLTISSVSHHLPSVLSQTEDFDGGEGRNGHNIKLTLNHVRHIASKTEEEMQ
jgi:hypothetical protein